VLVKLASALAIGEHKILWPLMGALKFPLPEDVSHGWRERHGAVTGPGFRLTDLAVSVGPLPDVKLVGLENNPLLTKGTQQPSLSCGELDR
jgi:hypothetical protein